MGEDADAHVPTYDCLAGAYGEEATEETKSRYAALRDAFSRAHGGASPDAYARSPGRVNLIGEHIDYEGYSVLPMAIGLDTVVAFRVNKESNAVTVGNTKEKYTSKTFTTDPSQDVDVASLHWTNYVMCGYKGVFDFLKESGQEAPPLVGLDLMIDGLVPT